MGRRAGESEGREMRNWPLIVFLVLIGGVILVATLTLAIYAYRMSYEKYCIRTGKPFRSWLGKGK